MNIALLGCGNTGHEVESAALSRGHSIAARFTSRNPLTDADASTLSSLEGGPACCIDFSTPAAAVPNIELCLHHKLPIVVGTTGWHDRLPEVRRLVERTEGALVYASNFSLGAHLYFRIVREAARLIDAYDEYDAAIHETHHRLKKDAPSGTARTIASILIDTLGRKQTLLAMPSALARPVAPAELCVSSTRVGSVFGTHTVTLSSEADDIELTHRAQNRKGFAQGAVRAAEWLQGRTGLFTAEDVFFPDDAPHARVRH